jgi:hypothetical protein
MRRARSVTETANVFVKGAAEMHALLQLVRAALQAGPVAMSWRSLDPGLFLDLAVKSKCARFVRMGAQAGGAPLPLSVLNALEALERRSLAVNATNMATLRVIGPALEARGVRYLIVKGPLAQHDVHGTHFAKISHDVDVLVPPHQMEVARTALSAEGFQVAPQCDSFWWRAFLREEHHAPPAPNLASVDLHSALSQPGTAFPRDLAAMFDDGRTLRFMERSIRIPGEADVAIISVISFIKALFNRESALIYLIDISAWISADPRRLSLLRERARVHRLARAVEFALAAVEVVLGEASDLAQNLIGIERERFSLLCVAPSLSRAPLRRSALMWRVRADAGAFLGGWVWRQAADLERGVEGVSRRAMAGA